MMDTWMCPSWWRGGGASVEEDSEWSWAVGFCWSSKCWDGEVKLYKSLCRDFPRNVGTMVIVVAFLIG